MSVFTSTKSDGVSKREEWVAFPPFTSASLTLSPCKVVKSLFLFVKLSRSCCQTLLHIEYIPVEVFAGLKPLGHQLPNTVMKGRSCPTGETSGHVSSEIITGCNFSSI